MAVSYKFSSLKYNVKGIYIFHLILVGILSILVLPVKSSEGAGELEERGEGGGAWRNFCSSEKNVKRDESNLLKSLRLGFWGQNVGPSWVKNGKKTIFIPDTSLSTQLSLKSLNSHSLPTH